eukprot:TRINITY_DN16792_c0_g1_i2.p1 TRINITY_DN16792_c0_g1~~TRINITY_DN16792_c0_g1_i2.p1  ORF type:complete len:710 (+),score=98.01 TRINITY_DN16792_c0_g1_i2:89-2218(+)
MVSSAGRDSAVLALLVVALYAGTLHGKFLIDDGPGIARNRDVDSAKSTLWQLMTDDYWGVPIASDWSHKSYRPLTVLSFRWNFAVAGFAPWVYHGTNIALYVMCSVLWYLYTLELGVVRRAGALVSGLVFALHPMHVENVAYISGRADLMGFLFFVLSLTAYRRCGARGRGAVWYPTAVACCVAAYLSKEHGLCALPVGAAVDLITCGRALQPHAWSRTAAAAPILRTVLSAGVCVVLLAFGKWVRGGVMDPMNMEFAYEDNPLAHEPSAWRRALWWMRIHAQYLILLVFPAWSCSDYGYNVIPYPSSHLPAAAAYAAVFVPPLLAARTRFRDGAGVAFALLILTFLPSSGILTVAVVLGERLLLFPSAGYSLAVGLLAEGWDGCSVRPSDADAVPVVAQRRSEPTRAAKRRHSRAEKEEARDAAPQSDAGGTPCRPVVQALLWTGLMVMLVGYAVRARHRADMWTNAGWLALDDRLSCAHSVKTATRIYEGMLTTPDAAAVFSSVLGGLSVDAYLFDIMKGCLAVRASYAPCRRRYARLLHRYLNDTAGAVAVLQKLADEQPTPETTGEAGRLLLETNGDLEAAVKYTKLSVDLRTMIQRPQRAADLGNYATALARRDQATALQGNAPLASTDTIVQSFVRALKCVDIPNCGGEHGRCSWLHTLLMVLGRAKRFSEARDWPCRTYLGQCTVAPHTAKATAKVCGVKFE